MQEYFKNLNIVDPLFHALVTSRMRKVQESQGLHKLSIDDLTEQDELQILRDYCVTLYKEYRSLRTTFIENMQLNDKLSGSKPNMN
jgi:hypothetical protein